MRPASERWHYIVTSSLIGRVHTQNDTCFFKFHENVLPCMFSQAFYEFLIKTTQHPMTMSPLFFSLFGTNIIKHMMLSCWFISHLLVYLITEKHWYLHSLSDLAQIPGNYWVTNKHMHQTATLLDQNIAVITIHPKDYEYTLCFFWFFFITAKYYPYTTLLHWRRGYHMTADRQWSNPDKYG